MVPTTIPPGRALRGEPAPPDAQQEEGQKVLAASAIFPALLSALIWRRFNTTGAVAGVLTGTVSAIGLVIISPAVWGGGEGDGLLSFYTLNNPGIISIPLGFLACWLGTRLGSDELVSERSFDEIYVRSETGLGAELGSDHVGTREEEREPAGAGR